MPTRRKLLGALCGAGSVLAGCVGDEVGTPADSPEGLAVSTPVFEEGGPIPERYTCAGADVSVPLGVEAPDDLLRSAVVLDAARQGRNDFRELGYRGPCPPEGDGPHTYRVRCRRTPTARRGCGPPRGRVS